MIGSRDGGKFGSRNSDFVDERGVDLRSRKLVR